MEAQAFCIHELIKIIVIYKDKDLIYITFQVVLPSFKYINDS